MDTTPSNLPEKEIINVAYGNDPQQKFDIYLPKGRTKAITKTFILIHGGGWTSGDKADFNGGISVLKNAYFPDYAIVNINYILGNVATGHYALPDQINDIQKVIEFITSHADEYNIKPEFVLCGHSAGAHLSMYYAYTKNNPAVKAVISLAGPTDFEDPFYANNIILQFLVVFHKLCKLKSYSGNFLNFPKKFKKIYGNNFFINFKNLYSN
ncbi:MAG: alpha/beta hydrolase, partial [Saprospiraceae bacterium]|nr:alpha/beta hydrolase [Saprospiraceae bacterium]